MDLDNIYFDLHVIIENINGIYINYSMWSKVYKQGLIKLDFKKLIKIILFKIQREKLEKDIFLKFKAKDLEDSIFEEVLKVIKFTGLLHCFTIILLDKNDLTDKIQELNVKYTDLNIIQKKD